METLEDKYWKRTFLVIDEKDKVIIERRVYTFS